MRRCFACLLLLSALLAAPALAHDAPHDSQRLPVIGPATDFTLTAQDGKSVSMHEFRGKVVAVAFIYTFCPDVCPALTAQMASVRQKLGSDFGTRIAFLSITVDPERDTPDVLKDYAENFEVDGEGWSFLTGDPGTIHDVALKYGVVSWKAANGDVEHTLLTSIVDPAGALRVQYLGATFDPEEFRRDLLSLADEAR